MMKIHCCQFDIAWEDKPANFTKVESLLAAADLPRGSLVLLPELFATGFTMNVTSVGEKRSGPTEQFLARTALDRRIFLMGGLVTLGADGRGRNEAVVFSPKGLEVARYCKMQPFTQGGEGLHYTAGSEVVIFKWPDILVAPYICYDLRFPVVFRPAARRGVQLITVIASWPVTRIQHWVTLLQARAIENQAYVAGVNRCGNDPRLTYTGRSIIVGPRGDILADAGDAECVISAEVDVKALHRYRTDFPVLADMRPAVWYAKLAGSKSKTAGKPRVRRRFGRRRK